MDLRRHPLYCKEIFQMAIETRALAVNVNIITLWEIETAAVWPDGFAAGKGDPEAISEQMRPSCKQGELQLAEGVARMNYGLF